MTNQLLINSIIAGCIYALFALSISVIYRITRFLNFAHAAIYAWGAYALYSLFQYIHLQLFLAIPSAMIIAALLAISVESIFYRPLRRRYAGNLVLLIASLGIYIFLQNVISLFFGDDVKTLRTGQVIEGYTIAGARITPIQLTTLGMTALLFMVVGLVLSYTRLGKAFRASANDPTLAHATGIDTDRLILFAFGLGSALAAVAAILVSFDVDITPTMGMNALLMGVVVMIIGGVGSIPGALVGGVLLGFAQQFGVWKIGSEWQDAIAFGILLIFLLFRPYGIFGRKLRKAEV
jgi:branched-chain amino acid transport system permease protein